MRRPTPLMLFALLAGCSGPQPQSPAGATRSLPLALRNNPIDLPTDDAQFPALAGADLLNQNCLACHSATMVEYQPKLSQAQWEGVVTKMKDAYHAPIAAEEMPAIVTALMTQQAERKD